MKQQRPDVRVPIDVATTPRTGACLADRWWIVVDDSIILWRGTSPQCNHDRSIAEHVGRLVHPGSTVRHIPAVFLGPQDEDGRYINPLPQVTTTPENVECPNDCIRFGGKVPGHTRGSNWDWVPCGVCNGTMRVPPPENVECQTCGGDGYDPHDEPHGITDCPDCTPGNVEEPK